MNFKLWRNYSAFLKTVGFWVIVIGNFTEPNLLISIGSVAMLAAWYFRDYIEKQKPISTHRVRLGHRDCVVEEMSILLAEYPDGRHAAFFERTGEGLVGKGNTVDQAMHDLIRQMTNRFGGPDSAAARG